MLLSYITMMHLSRWRNEYLSWGHYFDFNSFSTNVPSLFQDPVQGTTLHSVVMSPLSPLMSDSSSDCLVFHDLNCFKASNKLPCFYEVDRLKSQVRRLPFNVVSSYRLTGPMSLGEEYHIDEIFFLHHIRWHHWWSYTWPLDQRSVC